MTDIMRPLGDRLHGVSSLAAGADQLFAAIVLRLGGHLHAVIPCAHYELSFAGPEDRARFFELLAKAETTETLDHPEPSEEAYLDAGQRVADRSQILIAVWDGKPSRGKGGTADIVQYARDRGIQVSVVWPPGLAR